jgi:hypothetical protein
MDPRIEEYIRANRRTYTREAIRQQLIDAGHDPAAIDATWEMMHAPDPDEAGVAGEGFWGRFFLFLVGLNVAVLVLVGLGTGMLGSLQAYSVVLIVLAVALGIGALISWGIVAAVGPEKLGRTTAMVIGAVVPVVFALLIGGTCYALVGAIGPPPPPPIEGVMDVSLGEPLNFEATGPTSCQAFAESQGFNVFSQNLGIVDGREVTVSVGSFNIGGPADGPTPAPAEPGVEPGTDPENERSVNVVLVPTTETEANAPREWSVGGGTRIEMDAASDGLSGTVTFTGLEPFEAVAPVEPGQAPEGSLDGTISWTCEGGE